MEIDNLNFGESMYREQEMRNQRLLPEGLFTVYARGHFVSRSPWIGCNVRYLPTFNHYEGPNGGYVAIYTRDPNQGVYSVGEGIYVAGQVRVEGTYNRRIFVPLGFSLADDITQDSKILEICTFYFPDLKGKMWIGGDTGGWFGLR
jgi:hypothetical protein